MFNSFIRPISKVVKKVDRWGDVTAALMELQKKDVLVGIPQQQTSRRGEEPTNAELAFIHEHGSPLKNIPARPIFKPALTANIAMLQSVQVKVIQDAMAGKASVIPADLQKLGLLGQNIIRGWFVDPRNAWAPNAPVTIARKGSDRPLIDTGALRAAMTYVVRDKA